MLRSRVVALTVLCLLGSGCSQAEDAARGAASDAASAAAGSARDQVRQQICSRVQDGQVSAEDKQVLGGLVGAARTAGVSEQVLGPLDEVARSGDSATAQSVTALREACAAPAG